MSRSFDERGKGKGKEKGKKEKEKERKRDWRDQEKEVKVRETLNLLYTACNSWFLILFFLIKVF